MEILKAVDLFKQTVMVNNSGQFIANFPNIFTHYPLGAMQITDRKWKNWENSPMNLWQTQLNFAMFCASSACGVSAEHLTSKIPMIRSVYRFHVYYHVRRILKRLQVALPYQNGFSQFENPYSKEAFLEICSEYGVDSDPMKYRGQYFASSFQRKRKDYPTPGLSYFTNDSATRWIIEKSSGLTKTGLVMISESVRAYAYLILSSQASARSSILGNSANALTAQQAFLNNFENIVNRRVDIQKDIKRYQDTLNYASSKVDFSVGENVYMLPSDMNLKIEKGISGYNNEILISKTGFALGVNNVNYVIPEKHEGEISHGIKHIKPEQRPKPTVTGPTHEDEKISFILLATGIFTIFRMFR